MCIFFSLCWGIPTHYSIILFWKSRLTNITDDNPRCSHGISYRSLALSLHPLESLTGLEVKRCVRCFPLTQLQSQASHSVPSLHENSLHYTKAGFAKRINQRQFQYSSDLMVHLSEFLLTQLPWKVAIQWCHFCRCKYSPLAERGPCHIFNSNSSPRIFFKFTICIVMKSSVL